MTWLRRLIPSPLILLLTGVVGWQLLDFNTTEPAQIPIESALSKDLSSERSAPRIFVMPEQPNYDAARAKIVTRPLFTETRRNPELFATKDPSIEPVALVDPLPEPEPVIKVAPAPVLEPRFPALEFRGFVRKANGNRVLVYHPSTGTE